MTVLLQPVSGNMRVQRYGSRAEMGRNAAADIAAAIRACQARHPGAVRMIFAAAPSQQETLLALAAESGIDWRRVTAFHMDEYVGLPADAPQRFGNWLQRELFCRLPFGQVHLLDPGTTDASMTAATTRYEALLAEAPIDIVCMGIGVNGHLAFNDPPVADFNDSRSVKIVELDQVCRQQQVDDACFAQLADVPARAITLTIPRLLACTEIFCVVPGAAKRKAVRSTLYDTISTATPATILRRHPACTLYLDADSAPENMTPT